MSLFLDASNQLSLDQVTFSNLETVDGDPIHNWPPGFSVYLAATQSVFGVSGRGLVVSVALATGIAAFGWGLLAWRHARARGSDEAWPIVVSAGFCAALLVRNARDLRSETVYHALIPLGLLAVFGVRDAASRSGRLTALVALVGVGAGCMLLRNASLALVCGWVWMGFTAPRRPLSMRAVTAGVVLVGSVAPWWWIRTALGQTGSFPVGFAHAEYAWFEYVAQTFRSLGKNTSVEYLGQAILVACAVAMWRGDRDGATRGRAALGGTAVACLALFAMFNLTEVVDKLAGRFTLFVSLTLGCLGIVDAARVFGRRTAIALVAVALAYPVVKVTRDVVRGFEPAPPAYTDVPYEQFVSNEMALRRASAGVVEGRRIVEPPPIRWRRGRALRPDERR